VLAEGTDGPARTITLGKADSVLGAADLELLVDGADRDELLLPLFNRLAVAAAIAAATFRGDTMMGARTKPDEHLWFESPLSGRQDGPAPEQ